MFVSSVAPLSDLLAFISARNGKPLDTGGAGAVISEEVEVAWNMAGGGGVGGGGGAGVDGAEGTGGAEATGGGGAPVGIGGANEFGGVGAPSDTVFLYMLLRFGLTLGIDGAGAIGTCGAVGGRGRVGTPEGGLGALGRSEGDFGIGGAPTAGALGADAFLLTGFSFEIPPARISPRCGPPVGTGGAEETADVGAGPLPPLDWPATPLPPTCGALLSFVSAFFNLAPFLMSPSNASLPCIIEAPGLGADDPAPNPGGGGGGGGGAGMIPTSLGIDLPKPLSCP